MKVYLVVIDYRKGDGATVLGPYDSRAKADAAVSHRCDGCKAYLLNGGHEDESYTILEREVK